MKALAALRRLQASGAFVLAGPSLAAIKLAPVVPGGLSSPVFVGHAGDGTGRLFIEELTGLIRVLQPGASVPTTFLDLRAKPLREMTPAPGHDPLKADANGNADQKFVL